MDWDIAWTDLIYWVLIVSVINKNIVFALSAFQYEFQNNDKISHSTAEFCFFEMGSDQKGNL